MAHDSVHQVVVVALPGVVAADLSVAAQVFGFRDEATRYSFAVAAAAPGPVPTSTGFAIDAALALDAVRDADTVLLPGYYPVVEPDPEVVRAVRAAHDRGARVASVCVGAFVLAATGLLDGRRATTHWREAEEFQRRYPAVRLDPDVLYVDGGDVLTGAGQSASLDFYIHLVRSDFGAAAADAVARRMVVSLHRPGDQAQDGRKTGRAGSTALDPLTPTLEWAIQELHRPLSLGQLAGHADMSPRTFSRRFRERTGMAPMRWLAAQRVLEAQYLLESTDLAVDDVAARCGLGTAASLRAHMAREIGSTPTDYRRTHRRPVARS
jgi:transcriptional regulator GlxA family with amidase domain